MKKSLFISFIATIGILQSYSQAVSFKEAEQIANNFFGKTHKSLQNCAEISVMGTDTLFYVFNSNNGFVVISADKKAIPVLAYSTENVYDAKNVIPPVKMWMDYYQNQLFAIRNDKSLVQSASAFNSWEELKHPVKTHKNIGVVIPPLLTSKWGQGTPYNYYCPKDETATYNKRAVAGCVATAMAQLMYYFRFPQKGAGDYAYIHDDYGEIAADFESAVYDYSAMTDNPATVNPAISLLIFHCGVAVDMVYGAAASGMYNHKAAYALKTHFNFSPKTQYVFRDSTNLDWDSLIISHLDNKIPLYYAGWSNPHIDGHAFICDGYQIDSNNNYYYHFNFGWDGRSDAYFYTDTLSPNPHNFNLAQELIINAYPDTAKYSYPSPPPLIGSKVLDTETGSFAVGMLYDCPQNMDYKWTVRPNVDDIQKMPFNINYKLAQGDTIFVVSLNGSENHIFTNDTSAFSKDIIDTEFFVRLKTTNTLAFSGGFTASYTTNRKNYCASMNLSQTKNGTIDDGSGNSRYNNLSNCRYGISVNGVSSITLYFSKFETEKDKDILYIYDYSQSGYPVLAELSGILEDSVYTFNTNRLYFEFKTDEKNIYNGWTFYYDTDVTNVSDFEKDNTINIYPNPTTGQLKIAISDNSISDFRLFDVMGRLLKSEIVNLKSEIAIDISDLANGVYYLKITDEKNRVIFRKIVKK